MVDRPIEQVQELCQTSVVHPIHLVHVGNTEVQNAASSRSCFIDIPLFINFMLLLLRVYKFLLHFLDLGLNTLQDLDKVDIIQQVPGTGSQALQKLLVQLRLRLLVHSDFLIELLQRLFQRL